jgi:hypothetical protein
MGRKSNLPIIFDFCYTLSILELKHWEYLSLKYKCGTIIFKNINFERFEVSIQARTYLEKPYIELNYNIKGTEFNYRIYFELLPSNIGKGFVWFFICPITNKRCRKLYFINNYFCHRSACNFGFYQTQTLSKNDKLIIRDFDRARKANKAEYTIHNKHFKKYYKGKPTKRYLKLLKQIETGKGICMTKLILSE